MHTLRFVAGCSFLFALSSTGCDPAAADDDDDEGPVVQQVSNDECVSGQRWVGGDAESPRMHPGGDCMGCHEQQGEGPTFLAAGTVYELLDEPDECFGFEGATIEITDADDRVFTLPTNAAGNFYLRKSDGPLAMPYEAAVIVDGQRRAMVAPQASGNCASCHTASGASGAPGRIVLP